MQRQSQLWLPERRTAADVCQELLLPICRAGTGKTTIARRLGKLFKSLGLLASEDVTECSASDFVTGYVNQSSGKTRQVFESAVGQVLFIDEAYR
jgi:tRNA splicing ligase